MDSIINYFCNEDVGGDPINFPLTYKYIFQSSGNNSMLTKTDILKKIKEIIFKQCFGLDYPMGGEFVFSNEEVLLKQTTPVFNLYLTTETALKELEIKGFLNFNNIS